MTDFWEIFATSMFAVTVDRAGRWAWGRCWPRRPLAVIDRPRTSQKRLR